MTKLAEELATVEIMGVKNLDTKMYTALIKYGEAVRNAAAKAAEPSIGSCLCGRGEWCSVCSPSSPLNRSIKAIKEMKLP